MPVPAGGARGATLRTTRQRTAVRAALDDLDEFRSAQQLHAVLRDGGERVGLTTVYRTLAALTEAGEVDAISREDGETVYRRCAGAGHHHHLVCRDCGRTVEVAGPTVERWADRVAGEHGYQDVSHTVEIFGRCPACAAGTR